MTDTATETTVRPIVVGILADHEDWAYLLHPELPVRPATASEMGRIEDQARAEYERAMARAAEPAPHPPMCGCHAKAAQAAAEPVVTPGDYLDGREDEADTDLPPNAIAQMAAERVAGGIGELTEGQEKAFTAFSGAFAEGPAGDGDRPQPDATAVMPAAEQHTEAIPAVTEEGAE